MQHTLSAGWTRKGEVNVRVIWTDHGRLHLFTRDFVRLPPIQRGCARLGAARHALVWLIEVCEVGVLSHGCWVKVG